MEQFYWITEYLKLLLAYGFTLYIWPSVVFRRYLRGRGRGFRFAFCTMVMVLLVNTAVLFLGLLHVLTPTVTALLFYFTFLIQLARWMEEPLNRLMGWLKRGSRGTMSRRRLLLTLRQEAGRRLRQRFDAWREGLRGRRLEFALLLLLLAFGTLYFSWGAFDEHSYGFGDQYVHHQWIYGLVQGKAFYDGIYPEGMHCMIYLVCTAFGIPLYDGVLFFAGIHVHLLLLSAYLFMREVFHWRCSPLIALCLFLTLDQLCVDEIYGMSRLSWTLPMEYGLFTEFFSALYLMRYLRRVRAGEGYRFSFRKPKEWAGLFRDGDLLLFGMAVSASLAIHFYVTIAAVFFCAAVVIVHIRQLFRRGAFLSLAAAVLLGFFLAVLPMGAAYVAHYPLQGSLYWAMNVINGTDRDGQNGMSAQELFEMTMNSAAPSLPSATPQDGGQTSAPDGAAGTEPTPEPVRRSLLDRLGSAAEKLKDFFTTFYWSSYHTLYPGPRSLLIVGASAFALLAALLGSVFLALRRRRRRKAGKQPGEGTGRDVSFSGYVTAVLLAAILMFDYASSQFGLPTIIAGSRLCSSAHMLMVLLYVTPVDLLMLLLARRIPAFLNRLLPLLLCLGIYVFTQAADVFHGYPYFELTRYSSAVETTNRIIRQAPRQGFTVVSTTDELYHVIEHGYHEELMVFLQKEEQADYTIPTPYIFLYVEKHPIKYAQYHFARGPKWLASQKYTQKHTPAYASQCPEILGGEISPEYADMPIKYGEKLSDSYSDLEGRCIIESKAMRWLERFRALYPQETQIIYEDDTFLCCCIVQNKDCLFSLGIMAPEEEAETMEGTVKAE